MTVQVIDKDFKTPVKNADILLNTYRTYTDEHGIAKVEVPKGAHEFYVSAHNYEIYQGQVEIAGDVTVNVELVPAPF